MDRRAPPTRGCGSAPHRTAIGMLLSVLVAGGACAGGAGPGDADEWDVLLADADLADARSVEGTVAFRQVEGGAWVIESGDTTFDPMNLPEAYQVEGLAVEADVRVRDDVATIRMVGTVVEILRIRRVEGGLGGASPG